MKSSGLHAIAVFCFLKKKISALLLTYNRMDVFSTREYRCYMKPSKLSQSIINRKSPHG